MFEVDSGSPTKAESGKEISGRAAADHIPAKL
jgi:hypothetical protein